MAARRSLVARQGWVDGSRPMIDTSGERLGVLKALIAQPEGDVERAGAVVAVDDDWLVGVELLMRA